MAFSPGLRFVFQDELLRPMMVTIVFLHMFAQSIFVALPVLAYDHYGASARTAGLLFGAWGAGSIIGSLAAIPLARRLSPLTQATIGVVWVSMPLMLLGLALPAVGAMGVLFASGLGAVASAPLMAMITTRAPEQLRAKVMTAVITVVTISGPVRCSRAGTPPRVLRRARDPLCAWRRADPHGGALPVRRSPRRADGAAGG